MSPIVHKTANFFMEPTVPRAANHPEQERRLKALRSFDILDTEREPAFDDIVAFASELCGTAVSMVNLIDTERQWTKAEVGMNSREMPLETSICSHAILEDGFVEIPDTHRDSRMIGNPLCHGDSGMRFYAGAPLKTRDGLPLGSLCVLDHQPRRLTALQRRGLEVLAQQVMTLLELRQALRNSVVLRQEVDHRVKNSLQMLSSFVRIAGRKTTHPEAQDLLSVVQARIGAMIYVHERLYRRVDQTEIELTEYLGEIGDALARNAPSGVTLTVSGDPVTVQPGTAVALATLTNELVSNAFKHGFPNGRTGQVAVTLKDDPAAKRVRLICADNGIGSQSGPAVPQEKNIGGLGMQVAKVLATELSGGIDVQSDVNGFVVSIEFPAVAIAS